MRGSIHPFHMLSCHKHRESFYLWTPCRLLIFSTFDCDGHISSFFHSVYIKLSLFMSLRPVGIEVQLHSFLTSALDVALWSSSRPGLYYVVGTVPDTLWKGGLLGVPQNWSGSFREQKLHCLAGNRTPLIIQPVAQSLCVGTSAFGSDLLCAGCQMLFLLDCLVFGNFTFNLSTALICYENFIWICFENVIFIVSGLLSCWFRSLYSIQTQKQIEMWERPLFLKTLQ
jgi:hypothetical protein